LSRRAERPGRRPGAADRPRATPSRPTTAGDPPVPGKPAVRLSLTRRSAPPATRPRPRGPDIREAASQPRCEARVARPGPARQTLLHAVHDPAHGARMSSADRPVLTFSGGHCEIVGAAVDVVLGNLDTTGRALLRAADRPRRDH